MKFSPLIVELLEFILKGYVYHNRNFFILKIIVVFRTDLHKMKIKHRIIGEYATKRCFFRYKKADHRYWRLINYSLTWARPNLLLSVVYAISPDAAAWMLKFLFVYLANTAVLCYSLTIICCCQVQDYIYWIISTENYHRHHHKFMKYEKRLRKEGKNMLGLPIQQNLCHFSASLNA